MQDRDGGLERIQTVRALAAVLHCAAGQHGRISAYTQQGGCKAAQQPVYLESQRHCGTAQDRDGELERIQTVEGAAPLAAAVAADALAHSLPGLNLLLAPASELFGAAVRPWAFWRARAPVMRKALSTVLGHA